MPLQGANPTPSLGGFGLREMLDNYRWISPRWTEFKRWARFLLGR